MTTVNDPWPQECQNKNSMESKSEGTTTLNDLHHTMGSKIGSPHLHWPQERQNQNSPESKVEEDVLFVCLFLTEQT